MANAGGLSEEAKYCFGTFIEDIYFVVVIEWTKMCNLWCSLLIVTKVGGARSQGIFLLCIARGVIIGVKGAMEILQKDRFIFYFCVALSFFCVYFGTFIHLPFWLDLAIAGWLQATVYISNTLFNNSAALAFARSHCAQIFKL